MTTRSERELITTLVRAAMQLPPDACWVWPGRVGTAGYGQQGTHLIHRLAYEALVEPIPPGLTIDHLCRNKRCYNPRHLEVVSRAENASRDGPYRRQFYPCPECGRFIRSKQGLGMHRFKMHGVRSVG